MFALINPLKTSKVKTSISVIFFLLTFFIASGQDYQSKKRDTVMQAAHQYLNGIKSYQNIMDTKRRERISHNLEQILAERFEYWSPDHDFLRKQEYLDLSNATIIPKPEHTNAKYRIVKKIFNETSNIVIVQISWSFDADDGAEYISDPYPMLFEVSKGKIVLIKDPWRF